MSTAHNVLTTTEGILGLSGFTDNARSLGCITKSISSIGIAPNNTVSPSTNAPVKQLRLANCTRSGPTYGTEIRAPFATVTSLFSISCKSNCTAICSGMHTVIASESTSASTLMGDSLVLLGLERDILADTNPIYFYAIILYEKV